MTTQEILNIPFNWTGLSFLELVNAGRIAGDDKKKGIESIADKILKEKFSMVNGGVEFAEIQNYLKERKSLIAEISAQVE